ncbi:hypothetical protein JW824_15170 [bacterium]|nr:hypothetical protein [bacterium]
MEEKGIPSKRGSISFVILFIFIFTINMKFGFSQQETEILTRQEAINLIVNEIVQPFTLDHHVMVFLGTEMIQPGRTIWPYFDEQDSQTITKPTWFAWINDYPDAYFAHDTRYIFIDANTGEYEVRTAQWWPVLDGESLWMTDEEWLDELLVIYSNINIE